MLAQEACSDAAGAACRCSGTPELGTVRRFIQCHVPQLLASRTFTMECSQFFQSDQHTSIHSYEMLPRPQMPFNEPRWDTDPTADC